MRFGYERLSLSDCRDELDFGSFRKISFCVQSIGFSFGRNGNFLMIFLIGSGFQIAVPLAVLVTHFRWFFNVAFLIQGSSTDIRQVSCNDAMMTTSFTKEWSDDDSSHSSEEFMYVKGGIDGKEARLDDGKLVNVEDNRWKLSTVCLVTECVREEEEEKVEKIETQKTTDEKSSENIEVVDIEMGDVGGAYGRKKSHHHQVDDSSDEKKSQIPATPIFHGGEFQFFFFFLNSFQL